MFAAGLVSIALVLGCGSEGPVVPYRAEPLFYLVLNQRALSIASAPGLEQRALLLTVGSPTHSDYRVAQQFEMRRVQDGALFGWSDLGLSGRAPAGPSQVALHDGNYALPDSAPPGTLGARDIMPNDTFDIQVLTDGVTIRGRVRVPDQFVLTTRQDGTNRLVAWPRVRGAASYSVELRGVTAPVFTRDTFFILPPLAQSAEIRVKALDDNLSRYVEDSRTGRSGIDTGFGVFGAITTASLVVPPE